MRIFVVDSFTDRPFAGNPAGVCLPEEPVGSGWMQRVAAEMRHSETAFVRPLDPPEADYELRWFTPVVEVDLCGHATLAAAHVLYETGAVSADRPIRFATRASGTLVVRRAPGGLEMDFPAASATAVEPPEGLAAALGAALRWTGRNGQDDLLAEVADAATVRALAPDLDALAAFDARGICVTAPGDATDPVDPVDFVSRFFAPRVGVPEDPVTGSAHCMLAPYWAARLGRDTLTGRQLSARGGTVKVALAGDRVLLTGAAVTFLSGVLAPAEGRVP
ncbi:oxidoreductase [Actinomadura craniellae]|uniref:Oxidoreductase n=1 Tax=Actinomadura craniellae TaxID=2231787 RepID=A0A365HBN9_9ACTN|nr:PhzF family phenazine biosynthesis protein [Actinomadura craniellae]RAY16505.1 oxidoreductase [Actinomadura craniellae]